MKKNSEPSSESQLFEKYLDCEVRIERDGDRVPRPSCKIADVIDDLDIVDGLKRMLRAMLSEAATADTPLDALDDQIMQLREVTGYLQYVAMSYGELRHHLRSPEVVH